MALTSDVEADYQLVTTKAEKRSNFVKCVTLSAILCMCAGGVAGLAATQRPATPSPWDCQPINAVALWQPVLSAAYKDEPLAKGLIRRFDAYLMQQAAFDSGEQKLRNVAQWLAPQFVYETVGFPSATSLADWCLGGEEKVFRDTFTTSVFSQMLFFGTDHHATTTSYGNVYWENDFRGIKATKTWTKFRVLDFYWADKTGLGEGAVTYNFMMIDFADLFRRVGVPVLPKAALPEGLFVTAAADDGVPAPLSVVAASRDNKTALLAAKGAVLDGWVGDAEGAKWWHDDLTFYGPGGIGLARGATQYWEYVIKPYRAAFTNRSCHIDMMFCEGNYCGAFVKLRGKHVGTYVGQPASNKTLEIRAGMHWRVVDGKAQEGWAIMDFPGFFEQLGVDFWAIAANGGIEKGV